MRRGHKAISASQCKYHPSIVTFLDVLGFREIVKQRAPEDVFKLLASVREFSAPRRRVPKHAADEPQAIVFSDLVVRVRQIDSADNLRYPSGVVFNKLLNLLNAQGELIMDGVLLRGAVALGDLFIRSGQVFGPALVEA